ncbi:MAG: hypothetical protein QGF00_18985, partial [Planctomycetota bacterium]|nr:hypothetical protein [Planctomycetota bacterium]
NYRNAFLKADSEMVVLNTSDPVYGIMSLIGLPEIIPIFSNEDLLFSYIRSGKVGDRRIDIASEETPEAWKPKGEDGPAGAKEFEMLKPEDSPAAG